MNYLIASHGRYAEGLANATKKLVGEKGINVICAYLDDTPINEQLKRIFDEKQDEEWIVFTDILGGSVNQEMIKNYMGDNVHIVAGANLDSVLRLIQIDSCKDIQEQIQSVLNDSRERMVFVNRMIEIGQGE